MSVRSNSVTKTTAKTAAGFGAALAGISAGAPAEAFIVDLNIAPEVNFSDGAFVPISTTAGSSFANNPFFVNYFAKQLLYFDGNGGYNIQFTTGLRVATGVGMLGKVAATGTTISPGFTGQTAVVAFPGIPNATGTFYAAFQTQGQNGRGDGDRVGWLKIEIIVAGAGNGALEITDGAIAMPGESILVGEGASAEAAA